MELITRNLRGIVAGKWMSHPSRRLMAKVLLEIGEALKDPGGEDKKLALFVIGQSLGKLEVSVDD